MRPKIPSAVLAALLLTPLPSLHAAAESPTSLTSHLRSTADLGEQRALHAQWKEGLLSLSTPNADRHAWAVIPAPEGGWDFSSRARVTAEIINTGDNPVGVMLWVVGAHGWDAVLDEAILAPQETRTFSCDLRSTFPDHTPKLNPGDLKQIQVMLAEPVFAPAKTSDKATAPTRLSPRLTKTVSLEVRNLAAEGEAPSWKLPKGRVLIPDLETGPPAPGKRVHHSLAGDEATGIYGVLCLPTDWQQDKKYPLIVEYPGNIFFNPSCYSTGLPDQCAIGYGITKGKGAICLSLPFIDRTAGKIAENGWGNADDTADYAIRMVREVCEKFGADHENVVLTGFSRGAIACGYIGLRHERIASLWKGFHACQHYDGDGWNGATLPDALVRAARFRGRSVFQTDNPREKFQSVMDAMKTDVIWAESGLGFHATAMFLDERPSTQRVRAWFWNLVEKRGP